MNQAIKIAVIGGTGKSGKYLTQQLIAQGYHIRMLLRTPASFGFANGQVELVKGNARDAHAVLETVCGCNAVISTLGQPAGEPSIFSTATRHILSAMRQCHIKRYIVTTGLNVDTPYDHKDSITKAGTGWMKEHYPKTTADKQVEYDLLVASDIDWTLVRLPLIAQTDERKPMLADLQNCPGSGISATDLAHFLIGQLSDTRYIRQAPFIANV